MSKTKNLVLISMFSAVIIILSFTPIGYIQLGVIKATIIHIPVILGSVLLGPKAGALLGVLFGATSMVNNTFMPSLLSFAFSPLIPVPGSLSGNPAALLVCFLPRILVGIIPFYVYRMLIKISQQKWLNLLISGVIGSLTNTLLVMHLIYFFFQNAYASVREISVEVVYQAVVAVIFVNGVPEAIVAGILTGAIGTALKKFIRATI